MNVEQEMLLSAFFDDQVDPDEKRRVEEAIASDPAAAETLHALGVVHDLIAGLPRPPAPDVADAVAARIATASTRPYPWGSWGPRLGWGLAASGIAASVALLVFVAGRDRSRNLPTPLSAVPGTPRLALAPTPTPTPTPAPESSHAVDEAFASQVEAFVAEAAGSTDALSVAGREPSPPPADPPGYRAIWTAEGPRREFTVRADAGEAAGETVATLLGQSTHRDYFRIDLPTPPGAAPVEGAGVAFAAILDPNEFATLRRRLDLHFRGRIEEAEADPEVSAMLAAVGRATSAPGAPAADVLTPKPEELALRFRPGAAAPAPLEPEGPPIGPKDGETPSAAPAPTRPAVVLIWIVAPAPD